MPEGCCWIEDLLVAGTLHELSAADRETLAGHLRECADCRQHWQALQEDDRRLSAFVQSTEDALARVESHVMDRATLRALARPAVVRGRQLTPRWSWVRYAAAAGVLAAVALGVSLLSGPHRGVAWAQVLDRVAQARDYICRIEKASSSGPTTEMVQYCSAEFGIRQDMYVDGRLAAVVHVDPDLSRMVTLIHRDRRYAMADLSAEELRAALSGSSPEEFVARFRQGEFTEIGRRRVDGTLAAGIETRANELWGGAFTDGELRLWVDVETQWPVRVEFEGRAEGGKTWMRQVMKDFQWNPQLSQDDFAYEIPTGYVSLGTIPRTEVNEDTAIAGLRAFARIMQGQYPNELVLASATRQFEEEESRLRSEGHLGADAFADLMAIQQTCEFFVQLTHTGKDPAYDGGHVRASDFDRVLLRWRLEDGRYRVVFGDLRSETVSADHLVRLEGR